MTLLDRPVSRRRRGPKILGKPATAEDFERLWDLAVELAGRPVPGVRMTEEQFEEWCDEDVKAEWVDGEVVLMSPESTDQITLGTWLTTVLHVIVESRDLGWVAGREVSIRLPRQRRRRSPDLIFVTKSRLHLIKKTYVDGAPDLVIELVSPDSQTRDRRVKFHEYERAGVREYWLFDTQSKTVEAYALGANKRFQLVEPKDERIASAVIPGFFFRPRWLMLPKLPPVSRALREMGFGS